MKKGELFFSVVIPLYQKEDYITRAIDSVVFQSYPNFEILVVDDGSTDNGPEIVSLYSDKRIRLIRQANQGVSSARNRGIVEAQYDYIALLDADDRWKPSFLNEMKRLIETYPKCGWYSCRRYNYYRHRPKELSYSELSEGVIEDYFRIAHSNDIVHSSAIVVPKIVFSEIGGFNVNVKTGEEDFVMWTKIAANYKVCYTDKPLSCYFFDEANLEKRLHVRDPDHFFEMMEEGNFYKNEFIADLALHRGLIETVYGSRKHSKETAIRYSYTKLYRDRLIKLRLFNVIPQPILLNSYRALKKVVAAKRAIWKKYFQKRK
ncbi:MAG: glycosyltransferase family 2 protein [Bacteroidales bacterium]